MPVPTISLAGDLLIMLEAVGKGWLPVAEAISEAKRILQPAVRG